MVTGTQIKNLNTVSSALSSDYIPAVRDPSGANTPIGLTAIQVANLTDLSGIERTIGYSLGNVGSVFYTTSTDAAGYVTYGGGANVMRGVPFIPYGDMTLRSISLYVTTGSAGRTAKVVVYNAGVDGMPSSLFYEGPSDLDCSTTNSVISQACSITLLKAKTYWFFLRLSNTGVSVRANLTQSQKAMGNLTVSSSVTITGLSRTLTYSTAAPDPFAFTTADFLTGTNTPTFFLEV